MKLFLRINQIHSTACLFKRNLSTYITEMPSTSFATADRGISARIHSHRPIAPAFECLSIIAVKKSQEPSISRIGNPLIPNRFHTNISKQFWQVNSPSLVFWIYRLKTKEGSPRRAFFIPERRKPCPRSYPVAPRPVSSVRATGCWPLPAIRCRVSAPWAASL